MYCPVDGDEFREGITRCPEHDVELVEQPPEDEDAGRSILDERRGSRLAFAALFIGASVYGLVGLAQGSLLAWASIRHGPIDFSWMQFIQNAAFGLALGAFGVLAGLTILRGFDRLSGFLGRRQSNGLRREVADEVRWTSRLTGRFAMRLLLALVTLFAVIWMLTGVLTSHESAQFRVDPFGAQESEPDATLVTLYALHYASFACGVGAFGVMAAAMMLRGHGLLLSAQESVTADAEEQI